MCSECCWQRGSKLGNPFSGGHRLSHGQNIQKSHCPCYLKAALFEPRQIQSVAADSNATKADLGFGEVNSHKRPYEDDPGRQLPSVTFFQTAFAKRAQVPVDADLRDGLARFVDGLVVALVFLDACILRTALGPGATADFFASAPRLPGAAVLPVRFAAAGLTLGFFAAARKSSGFVASIPMTRR